MTGAEPVGLSLGEIAQLVGGVLEGPADVRVRCVAGIEEAGPDALTFVSNPRYRAALATTRAGGVLVTEDLPCPPHVACIRTRRSVRRPRSRVGPLRSRPSGDRGNPRQRRGGARGRCSRRARFGPCAVVASGARLGAGTRIGAGCVIGERAVLGKSCYLYPRVVIGPRLRAGRPRDRPSGAVIGSDGFGCARGRRVPEAPASGERHVEDDVEIGANVAIDRATIGSHTHRRGTKIDNLVQIAHNVAIGKNCIIVAQVGISGSTGSGRTSSADRPA